MFKSARQLERAVGKFVKRPTEVLIIEGAPVPEFACDRLNELYRIVAELSRLQKTSGELYEKVSQMHENHAAWVEKRGCTVIQIGRSEITINRLIGTLNEIQQSLATTNYSLEMLQKAAWPESTGPLKKGWFFFA